MSNIKRFSCLFGLSLLFRASIRADRLSLSSVSADTYTSPPTSLEVSFLYSVTMNARADDFSNSAADCTLDRTLTDEVHGATLQTP